MDFKSNAFGTRFIFSFYLIIGHSNEFASLLWFSGFYFTLQLDVITNISNNVTLTFIPSS